MTLILALARYPVVDTTGMGHHNGACRMCAEVMVMRAQLEVNIRDHSTDPTLNRELLMKVRGRR